MRLAGPLCTHEKEKEPLLHWVPRKCLWYPVALTLVVLSLVVLTLVVLILVIKLCLKPGGYKKHNFWTSCSKSIRTYIFEILASKAIDWYIFGSNRRGGVQGSRDFGTPPPKNYWVTPTKF